MNRVRKLLVVAVVVVIAAVGFGVYAITSSGPSRHQQLQARCSQFMADAVAQANNVDPYHQQNDQALIQSVVQAEQQAAGITGCPGS